MRRGPRSGGSPVRRLRAGGAAGWLLLLGLGCGGGEEPCPRCDTLVIAALGEPDHLLPPFVWQSVGRDIDDLVYQRLAVLDGSRSPLDSTAYAPDLAARWDRVDSVTLRFHLRPDARWHNGTPVTAEDVAFSFAAFQDPAFDAVARGSLEGIRVVAGDSLTVIVGFASARPDQLYDATWHVRVFPRHVWDSVPRERWGTAIEPSRLIGSGPYRVTHWERGSSLILEAVGAEPPPIHRVVWRFAQAPEAAGNLLLSGEADLIETIPDPPRRSEYERAPDLRLVSYPGSVYGFLGFNLAGEPRWSDPRVRRALRQALDRETLARAVFGPEARVPPGPLSAQLWLWEGPASAPGDTAAAAELLEQAGWTRGRDGVRGRAGQRLAVDILVPATSGTRRSLATAIQERWARLGVGATVTVVDFPVFQERLGAGRFDSFIGAWLDEPHPRSLADQWTRSGWGRLNYGRYHNPTFDSLFQQMVEAADPEAARRLWGLALDTLNADAPAIWLYSLSNLAVTHHRLEVTRFAPFAWLAELPAWRLTAPRDSVGDSLAP